MAHPTGKGGKREDLGGLYFRSSMEANWARYLNWLVAQKQILGWEYEAEKFAFVGIQTGTRFYKPDFRVTNKNGSVEYHEVKGWMNPKSATQLKRMAKYHPTIKVIVVDATYYRSVARTVKGAIPGWE